MHLFNKVIRKLLKKRISVSTAESCTGGLLSSCFTSFSGISKIYSFGLITYSNKSKSKLLEIPNNYIKKYGAVSNEVAKKMIMNLHKISKSNLCISTTGIAGPGGGTKFKPVGLVFIGIKFNKKIIILKKNFKGSRKAIQNKTVKCIFKEINKLI
tara:strand:- start:620 stop:1084 length:465 start_codon:yes stop_codon:yes gene_type:complete